MFREYDYRSHELNPSHKYILPKVLGLLKKYNSKVIVDLGCGNGSVMRFLSKKGYKCVGIDASNEGVRYARNQNSKSKVLQGDITQLHNLDLSFTEFDTCICIEVLAHLYDPVEFMINLKNTMSNDTNIILTYPYHYYFKNLLIAITGRFDSHVRPLWRGGYVKFFSRRTFSALCKQTGFEIQSFHRVGRIPLLWKTEIVVLKKDT